MVVFRLYQQQAVLAHRTITMHSRSMQGLGAEPICRWHPALMAQYLLHPRQASWQAHC